MKVTSRLVWILVALLLSHRERRVRAGSAGRTIWRTTSARSINRYPRLTIFDDINATVENGVVVLTGKVTMPYKKDDLEKRIAKIDGVRSVRNDIGVLPVSQFDDELRYRVSRAIYGNPSFWNYAAMANPPIHIIVDGGHVTLAAW